MFKQYENRQCISNPKFRMESGLVHRKRTFANQI